MSRDGLLYLDDLIASAEKIGRMTSTRSFEQFLVDEALFDAVLFNLQIVGEAVKKIPEEARVSLPEVHRSAPARLRDLIAHHYPRSIQTSSGRWRDNMFPCCSPKPARCGCALMAHRSRHSGSSRGRQLGVEIWAPATASIVPGSGVL